MKESTTRGDTLAVRVWFAARVQERAPAGKSCDAY